MPDTSFLTAFAGHPLTLLILAVTVIVIVLIWRMGPNIALLGKKLDSIIELDKQQTMNIKYNTLDILRVTLYNTNIHIGDRLIAIKRYLVLGGNGKVAQYAKKLIAENQSDWDMVMRFTADEDKAKVQEALNAAKDS